jgi:hypothetical protein
MADLGVTGLLCAPWALASDSPDARREAVEAFAADFLPPKSAR